MINSIVLSGVVSPADTVPPEGAKGYSFKLLQMPECDMATKIQPLRIPVVAAGSLGRTAKNIIRGGMPCSVVGKLFNAKDGTAFIKASYIEVRGNDSEAVYAIHRDNLKEDEEKD